MALLHGGVALKLVSGDGLQVQRCGCSCSCRSRSRREWWKCSNGDEAAVGIETVRKGGFKLAGRLEEGRKVLV